MNILSYIHVHRLPNPSGVGRVIDRLLVSHAALHPRSRHRILVDGQLYDRNYMKLSDHWKMASFIPHKHNTSLQQAKWIWTHQPLAEQYWDDVEIVYCPAESYVPTRKAKLVCTIHDVAGFEEKLYPDSFSRSLHCLKWRILFREVARHASAVVTVSNFSASRIAHFFPELEKKLHVIYNAPHSIFGGAVAKQVEQQRGRLTGGCPYILVPGGLSLRKNADLIIQSLPRLTALLPEHKIIIAGVCERHYVHPLQSARSINVVTPGYVSDELLNALYQKAEAVWFPSRYEGFGMPVIEAMAAGTPVVASDAASVPEVAGNAALLCGVDNSDAHVEAIHSIVAERSRQDEMRSKSREQALKFTWANSARKLDELFCAL